MIARIFGDAGQYPSIASEQGLRRQRRLGGRVERRFSGLATDGRRLMPDASQPPAAPPARRALASGSGDRPASAAPDGVGHQRHEGLRRRRGGVRRVASRSAPASPPCSGPTGPGSRPSSGCCAVSPLRRGARSACSARTRADIAVRGQIGLAPQQDALFDRLTALQFVEIAAQTHGVDNPKDAAPHGCCDIVELDADDPKIGRATTRRACVNE